MSARLLLLTATFALIAAAHGASPPEMRTAQIYEHDSLRRVLRESKADVLTTQPSGLAIEEALQSLRRPPPGARFLSKSNFGVRIASGVHTASFPAVAALLHAPGGSFLRMACSATLVGSRTLLTAAHCVARDEDAQNYRAYFQHAGLVSVAEIAHPRDLYVYPAGDVAMVRLSEEVPGIAPVPINATAEIFTGTAGLWPVGQHVGRRRHQTDRTDDHGAVRLSSGGLSALCTERCAGLLGFRHSSRRSQ